ncbi:hypothetical protein GGR56DRAFT_662775 [Xylariaceae sp. FL0804]|nr:hypothetical protein GGR56DRAFT_662775 [Xylariaceae sp. FL0804]
MSAETSDARAGEGGGEEAAPKALERQDSRPELDDDDFDDNRSDRSTSSRGSSQGAAPEGALFISSTISKDDTSSRVAKRRDLLSQLKTLTENASLQLNTAGPQVGGARPMPIGRFPILPPGPMPHPHRFVPIPVPRGGRLPPHQYYPFVKASRSSQWRQNLMKKRGPDHPTPTEKPSPDVNPATPIAPRSERSSSPPEKTAKPQTESTGNLAESLGVLAETQLNIDILDESQDVSQFVSYLLDTINVLEAQTRFFQARDDDSESESDPEETSSTPRGQVLHRIYCTNPMHDHNRDVYEDEPVFRKSSFELESGLKGKTRIGNVDSYLSRRSEICFVVFKEHNCERDRDLVASYPPQRRGGRLSSEREERILIVSPLLVKAFTQIAQYPVYPPDQGEASREMDAPYTFLFHHRKELDTLAKNPMYEDVLKPLLHFLETNYGKEYEEADQLFLKGRVTDFHITKLYKPYEMVISRLDPDSLEAAVLKSHPTIKGGKISFSGWGWQYNGADLHRKMWFAQIDRLAEEMNISDMSIHPAEYSRKEYVQQLESRGEKFWSMKDKSYQCYTGWDKSHDHHYVSVNARFVVDVATYELMHHGTSRYSRDFEEPDKLDPWPAKINRREQLQPKALMLLPAITCGFNLHDKKWVLLYVNKFRPVDWNKKAFDRLVLDPKTKEMIHALVDVQTTAKKMDDIIAGKGNGLIVLLHGSPGTGKTLTAESVAEIAEKPLYRVTCGDIGTEASAVEKYLETVLYLGKTWDCVLLLDEADVFLEERTMADLQRNSLVSVFLRILEYYEGILILTSNRVGTFDEAFKSRIQVAVHYDNLTKKSRKAIWRNFFDMIEDSSDEDANMPELERRLDELAAEEMNGRQIRNALLTARQLAKHRQERLDWQHLSQVMKTSAAFNKYLKAVRGHSDEQWAREEQLR